MLVPLEKLSDDEYSNLWASCLREAAERTETCSIEDGTAGVAWVCVKPITPFGRWALRSHLMRRDTVWVALRWTVTGVWSASFERSTAFAANLSKVLSERGYDAWFESMIL